MPVQIFFATAFAPAPNQHTDGYQIESVSISHGDVSQKADFIINDTRMQIRLQTKKRFAKWGGMRFDHSL